MIRTQDLTPSIYYKESRDFQLFGRLYDIVFNYVKTNVDLMENFPINAHTDSKLIELLARTLGFNNKLNYRNDDLNAICNVFISLMRDKGSLRSIKSLVRTILNVSDINKNHLVSMNTASKYPLIEIHVPDVVSNSEIKLLEDVLEYILPIGVCYDIKTTKVSEVDRGALNLSDVLRSSNLLDRSSKEYSNINITNEELEMTHTDEKTSGELIESSINNPIVGDMRYSKVIGSETNNG